jgi:hypothetical protein
VSRWILESYYLREMDYYRAQVGTWARRFSWWSVVGHVRARGGKIYRGPMILCAAVLAFLLVIRGVKLNPGPVDNIVQILCSGCNRNIKLRTHCGSCGPWYHSSCGNLKSQVVEIVPQ